MKDAQWAKLSPYSIPISAGIELHLQRRIAQLKQFTVSATSQFSFLEYAVHLSPVVASGESQGHEDDTSEAAMTAHHYWRQKA
ncbi:hypothetical protein BDZ89DRAFT_1060604 [Hymenopellis radicata]|nr:hypothetical protein BDZ89DRAFT_1060604 [Hymenopellis radicata]